MYIFDLYIFVFYLYNDFSLHLNNVWILKNYLYNGKLKLCRNFEIKIDQVCLASRENYYVGPVTVSGSSLLITDYFHVMVLLLLGLLIPFKTVIHIGTLLCTINCSC